ncbi:MAG: branched-chain amino acid ABC transporter permease [Spirochaetales bacterium]|nr:branched-chain amino acid ABC transporter permease [Spirochaetales bacterium]
MILPKKAGKSMNVDLFFNYLVIGLTVGAQYAIVAIGFNIIYNTTGIINFAQGDFLILGAMVAISMSSILPIGIAIGVGVLVAAVYGAVVENVFIRRNRSFSPFRSVCIGIIAALLLKTLGIFSFLPEGIDFAAAFLFGLPVGFGLETVFRKYMKEQTVLSLIVLTIAVSILTREIMSHLWDKDAHVLPYFIGDSNTILSLGSISFSPQRIWVLGICALLVIGLYVFFKYTRYGKAMRACSLDHTAAKLCGINVRLMITISFIVSAAIAALAGSVISPLSQTKYDMGSVLAIKGFSVAILGGLGNSFAAVAGGLILGILEAFSVSIFPNAYKDVVAILLLLLILVFKPSGVFGSRQASQLKEF